MRIVTDAEQGAVLEPNPRSGWTTPRRRYAASRFKVPAVGRSVLDLAAIVIRHELAARGASERAPGIGKRAAVGHARRHQVARATIQRNRELTGWDPRAVDDRLVIANDKPGGIAELADAHRNEIGLSA